MGVRELFGRLGAEMQVDTVFWMSCMRHKQSRWTKFQNNDYDDNNYIANSYTHCVNGNNHRTVQIMVCELCGRLGAEMQVARMFWLPRMFRKATQEQRQLLCLIVWWEMAVATQVLTNTVCIYLSAVLTFATVEHRQH